MSALRLLAGFILSVQHVGKVPTADMVETSEFHQAEIAGLLQTGLAHAFEKLLHRAGCVWDMLLAPCDRNVGLQLP